MRSAPEALDRSVESALARASEELARAVLPWLLARVRTTTADLSRALGPSAPGATLAPDALALLDVLDGEAGATRDAGFLLGVIAAARGVDLLVARRDARGLAAVARLSCEAAGSTLEPGPELLPSLSTRTGRGWEVPLQAACLFLRCAPRTPRLRWSFERSDGACALSLAVPARLDADEHFLAALAPLVPGAEALASDERLGFRWPGDWFDGA